MVAKTKIEECFVVCAIGGDDSPERIHADWFLEEIVEPVFAELGGFEVSRADRINSPGLIDAQIIDKLLNSKLVIADLTFLNPNAFYEIGIRHVIQKPIIHVHREGERIPFDISLFRSMKFSVARPGHLRAARESLKALAEAVLADDYEVDNPVTKARGKVQFAQSATPADKVLQSELAALEQRLARLEQGPRLKPEGFDRWVRQADLRASFSNDRHPTGEVMRLIGSRETRELQSSLEVFKKAYPGSDATFSIKEIDGGVAIQVRYPGGHAPQAEIDALLTIAKGKGLEVVMM